MEKEFIPYEEALALKEMGFNELCFRYGDNISSCIESPISIEGRMVNPFNKTIKIPTFSQAFRWFRKKYDLDIDISRNDQEMIDYVERKGEKYLPKYKYGYTNGKYTSIGTCMKHEEAELACLRKLIEIVKNNHEKHLFTVDRQTK